MLAFLSQLSVETPRTKQSYGERQSHYFEAIYWSPSDTVVSFGPLNVSKSQWPSKEAPDQVPEMVPEFSATHSSLTCRLIVLTMRPGWWEPRPCCPARDHTRTSAGRTLATCGVCVQRHCSESHEAMEMHLVAFLSAQESARHSRWVFWAGPPKPGSRAWASWGSPTRSEPAAIQCAVQQHVLLPGLVVVLLCCWDTESSFKAALKLA